VSNTTSATDVSTYLSKVKSLVSAGQYDFVPRRINLMSLAKAGLSLQNAKSEILSLVSSEYFSGPEHDDDPNRPGNIWVFKKDINGTLFYIKIKIANENGADIVKCLSFHDDRPHYVRR